MPSMTGTRRWLACLLALGVGAALSACQAPPTRSAATRAPRETPSLSPTPHPTATQTPQPTPPPSTQRPLSSPTQPVVGPAYRRGFNPLTGLPVRAAAELLRPPVLVSITNFPPSARPQAGVSQAAHVWETSIGEGLSRMLAVYYGDYIQAFRGLAQDRPATADTDYIIGPVRSGRVAFELIRRLYPGGLLVTRSASPEVIRQLRNQYNVYAADPQDVNSAGLYLSQLETLTEPVADPQRYAGLLFDPRPPAGGEPAERLRIIYNLYTHVGWEYDSSLGAYLRLQDRADGSGALQPATERLTGEQLASENVIVIFARHRFENLEGTILTIELDFRRGYGLLFRDGRRYPIIWSTLRDRLRLLDMDGEPIALRPGRSFFQVVSLISTWDDEQAVVRFHSPPLPTLTPTRTPTPTVPVTPTATETPGP